MPMRILSLLAFFSLLSSAAVVGVQGVIYVGTGSEIGAITPANGALAFVTAAASSDDCDSTDDAGTYVALCIYQAGWTAVATPTFGSGPTNILGLTDDVAPGAPGTANQFVLYVDRTVGQLCIHLNGETDPFCSASLLPSGVPQLPNLSAEPVSCSSAVYGAKYFDTDDQRECICANDGTDDEWVKSDDYSHATGHCSI